MNQILQRSFCIAALCATCVVSATTIPYLAPRSQGINGARELVGWQSQINRWDMCCNYGSFSITPEYGQTFRPNRITEALFSDALIGNDSYNDDCHSICDNVCCDDCSDDCNSCNKILIQGSQVAGRDARALMAENFYLPTDYSSEITFKPKVQNFMVDFNYYQGLDEWAEGLYFRIHTPLAHTRWNLHYCETILDAGVNPMDAGYFSNEYTFVDSTTIGLNRDALLANFEEYVSDCKAIESTDSITYNALNSARWSKCSRTKTGLAEITAAFGWNFIRRECFLFGLNIRAAAPTGTRPHGDYLFEPIVGNGKHWELGGGLNMWWSFWKSCDEDRDFTMYLDAYVTHMFKTRQCRTFDLKDKPLSRYMLAMKFTDEVSDLVAGPEFDAPTAQFDNVFTPLANLTTIPVDVSYAAQGEVILKFAYTHCNFQFDLGYDFWGRTCEKICKRCDCCNNGFVDNAWGLKGDAFAYGFAAPTQAAPGTPLSATESLATIFAGTNDPIANEATWNTNPNIDNPQLAYNAADANLQTNNNGWANVNTSLNPVLLTETDLDIDSAKTKAYSNKIFTHLGYIWKEHECWTPYLGVGGEVEFGCRDKSCNDNCHSICHTSCHTSNNCNTDCNGNNTNCNKFAFTQWGIWLKGGLSFN
jgi:hypothetical protein